MRGGIQISPPSGVEEKGIVPNINIKIKITLHEIGRACSKN
jgi:hypothetical protein